MFRLAPALLALVMACGNNDAAPSVEAAYATDSDGTRCVDADGDGFGRFCADGPDCNDRDDTVFEDCPCTTQREGCACEPTEAPVECQLTSEQLQYDTTLCKTGLHYCRDGAWTECIGVAALDR